jgi:endonuclease/exonuclease/phosphatase (EEP) superfamily protein YafD
MSWLLLLAAIVTSVPIVLGFFGALHAAFDSLAHFRAHLAAAMALLALPLLVTALRREGLMALIFATGAFSSALLGISPGFGKARASASGEPVYSLVQFNMNFRNQRQADFLRLLARLNPDIVLLQEAAPANRLWLERTRGIYAYQHYCPSTRRTGGTAILSRRPWVLGSGQGCFSDGHAAVAQIDLGGRALDVVSLHSLWPWPHGQPQQLTDFEAIGRALGDTAIIAGDFNAAPWSNAVRRVARAANAEIHSPGPSWLMWELPSAWRTHFGLPIDQLLAKGVSVTSGPEVADEGGSDHAPVLTRFAILAAAEADETQEAGPQTPTTGGRPSNPLAGESQTGATRRMAVSDHRPVVEPNAVKPGCEPSLARATEREDRTTVPDRVPSTRNGSSELTCSDRPVPRRPAARSS